MRFAAYRRKCVHGLAAADGTGPFRGYAATDSRQPGHLTDFVARGIEGIGILRNPIRDQAA